MTWVTKITSYAPWANFIVSQKVIIVVKILVSKKPVQNKISEEDDECRKRC